MSVKTRAFLILYVVVSFIVPVLYAIDLELQDGDYGLELRKYNEFIQPTLYAEKQAGKRSLAQQIANNQLNEKPMYGPQITSPYTSLTTQESEYYLISIDLGANHLPESIYTVARVKKISKIGDLNVILVKTDTSRDQVLSELRRNGYYNYLVEQSFQHQLHTQPSLDRLDQKNLPLDGVYTPIGTAVGAHVYIVDSGILGTHVEFTGRYVQDFVVSGESTAPCDFHGSWVASNAAGTTMGVASEATIHDLKVSRTLLDCEFYTSDGIDALAWIYDNGTLPGVINLSWQGDGNSIIDAIIAQLFSVGYFIVAAAGNAGNSVSACVNSPARAAYALSVGAIDTSDNKASFSNYGDCVDIWAIGVNNPGAGIDSDTDIVVASGTSVSAPVVTGLAAMYYSLFHYTTPGQVAVELQLSALYGMVNGIPEDLSNNRLASFYRYTDAATTTTTTTTAAGSRLRAL